MKNHQIINNLLEPNRVTEKGERYPKANRKNIKSISAQKNNLLFNQKDKDDGNQVNFFQKN